MTTPNELVPTPPAPQPPLVHPWLVAGWPGIGGVASISTTYLVSVLGARPLGMIPERDFFSVNHVEVQGGIARAGRLPRSMFFVWRDPSGQHDLIIFVGEAQPEGKGYQLCRRILDMAQSQGVERVVSFAAMASALRPDSDPRVFGAVTAPDLLDTVREHGIELMREGQIGGLNGALLAAAAERGLPGICLLGEMPFFAANIPNPKAAAATLGAFSRLSGITFDTSTLEEQSRQMQGQLDQLFEQLQRHQSLLQQQLGSDEEQGEAEGEEQSTESEIGEGIGDAPPTRGLAQPASSRDDSGRPDTKRSEAAGRAPDEGTHRRIEELFERAAADRHEAFTLKAELDRLGLFETYENRFLDLFRKAE